MDKASLTIKVRDQQEMYPSELEGIVAKVLEKRGWLVGQENSESRQGLAAVKALQVVHNIVVPNGEAISQRYNMTEVIEGIR